MKEVNPGVSPHARSELFVASPKLPVLDARDLHNFESFVRRPAAVPASCSERTRRTKETGVDRKNAAERELGHRLQPVLREARPHFAEKRLDRHSTLQEADNCESFVVTLS